MLDVVVKNFPQTTFVASRHVGLYENSFIAWNNLMNFATKNNLLNNINLSFGLCYDDPDKTNNCRYDACLSISNLPNIELQNGIELQTIEEQKCIFAVHNGPYKNLYNSYTYLFNLPYNFNFTLPSIEVCINNPKQVNESELITYIYIPIL